MEQLLERLNTRNFGWREIGLVFFIALVAYGTQLTLPAFNPDDIIQLQPVSGDGDGYMRQGRWGYYLIATILFEMNPAGILPGVVTVLLISIANWLAIQFLGIKTYIAKFMFLLISTISLYYGLLIAFESARLVIAVGTLCASAGVYMWLRRRYFMSLALLLSAPAFYSPAIELALCLAIASAIAVLLEKGIGGASRQLASLLLAIFAAMALYYCSTFVASWTSGIPLNGRSSLRLGEAWDNLGGIAQFFLTYSLPFLPHESPYFSWLMKACIAVFLVVFVVSALASRFWSASGRRLIEGAALVVMMIGLLLAPYALAFATPVNQFAARSLYAFAVVHAIILAFTIDIVWSRGGKYRKYLASLVVAVGLVFVAENALAVSKMGYDDYLASESDLAAVNRIISRIDTVLATQVVADPSLIRIAVKAESWFFSGPRGTVASARSVPWAREWIFRFVDRRFVPADPETRAAAVEAAITHGIWPSADSVFLHEGVVVVRLD